MITRVRRPIRPLAAAALVCAAALAIAGCAPAAPPEDDRSTSSSVRSDQAEAIAAIVQESKDALHLKAVLVQVQVGDDVVVSEAYGESLTGMPATTAMHFRNGAVAFAYVSNLLLQYVDDGLVTLDDTIDRWVPELPESDTVTLRMLANQTSGYPDYETDPAWVAAYYADPFHDFTYDERIQYAFSRPMQFPPGTNWSYAHTNFMVLGEILSQIGGRPLDELLHDEVLAPLGLTETRAASDAAIPEPALHAYSAERRIPLQIPADVPFEEEATSWNPSWGTPVGAAQTTTIGDLNATAIAIGTGALLSEQSYHAMTDSTLIGFGERLDSCAPSCFTQQVGYNYGLGVVRSGEWMLQNPLLSGYSAVTAYLPAQRIAISVATTFEEAAFDPETGYSNAGDHIFRLIGAYLAPEAAPPMPPAKKP